MDRLPLRGSRFAHKFVSRCYARIFGQENMQSSKRTRQRTRSSVSRSSSYMRRSKNRTQGTSQFMRYTRYKVVLRSAKFLRFQPPNFCQHNITERSNVAEFTVDREDSHRGVAYSNGSAKPALLVRVPHAEKHEATDAWEDALNGTSVPFPCTRLSAGTSCCWCRRCCGVRFGFDL